MCGITGIFETREPKAIERDVLGRMNETQNHRGPDDGGYHIEPGVGLGHRRLSIIDVATGQQPLYNEDGSVVVIFNGEIYNFQELIPELTALGHRFRTRAIPRSSSMAGRNGAGLRDPFPGHVRLCALGPEPPRPLPRPRPVGNKPLYYAFLADGKLIFGSELKALLRHPGLSREIDPCAVEEYFALGYVADPAHPYGGASCRPPHSLKSSVATGLQPVTYWDLSFHAGRADAVAEATDELTARLDEAVRMRLISEVPFGAFLSGGVDSSSVVAIDGTRTTTREHVRDSFGDPAYDESAYAQRSRSALQTRHFVERVDSDDFGLIDTPRRDLRRAFADSSAIPTYRVCELARRTSRSPCPATVATRVFAGYRRYRLHMAEEWLRGRCHSATASPLFGALAGLPKSRLGAARIPRESDVRSLGARSGAGLLSRCCPFRARDAEQLFSAATIPC